MKREECTSILEEARTRSGLTYQEIADKLDRHVVWTAAALMGQATMDAGEARTVVNLLGLEGDERLDAMAALQRPPTKGVLGTTAPVDPLIYRLHEITQVYGPAIKEVIHEKFGDGVMSTIDFEIDVDTIPDPRGDRVKLTYNGKFLPYRKW